MALGVGAASAARGHLSIASAAQGTHSTAGCRSGVQHPAFAPHQLIDAIPDARRTSVGSGLFPSSSASQAEECTAVRNNIEQAKSSNVRMRRLFRGLRDDFEQPRLTKPDFQKILCGATISVPGAPEGGGAICSNIWLRIQAAFVIPSYIGALEHDFAQRVNIEVDYENHTASFVYCNVDKTQEVLVTQPLQPHEEDLFKAIVKSNPVNCTLVNLMNKINSVFSESYGIKPEGAEDGVEIHTLGGEEFFIYRQFGRICQLLPMPVTEIDGPEGAGKKIRWVDYKHGGAAVILERTASAEKHIRNTRGRRNSLTSDTIRRIVGPKPTSGITPIYQVGDDLWLSPMGSTLLMLPDLQPLKLAAETMNEFQKCGGVHADIKHPNLLLIQTSPELTSHVITDNRPYAQYRCKIIENPSGYIPSESDFAGFDIVLQIPESLIAGAPSERKLFVKRLDGKIVGIDYGKNEYLSEALNSVLNKSDLKNIVWHYKKFLITRGLPPCSQFTAAILDWWRAVAPNTKLSDPNVSIDEKIVIAMDMVERCFETTTPTHSVENIQRLFAETKEKFKKAAEKLGIENTRENKLEVLNLVFKALRIAQLADDFAFILVLLQSQGYSWHMKMASPDSPGGNYHPMPLGLPPLRYATDKFYNPELQRHYKIILGAGEENREFNDNVLILKNFKDRYIPTKEAQKQFLELMYSPAIYFEKYNSSIPVGENFVPIFRITDIINFNS